MDWWQRWSTLRKSVFLFLVFISSPLADAVRSWCTFCFQVEISDCWWLFKAYAWALSDSHLLIPPGLWIGAVEVTECFGVFLLLCSFYTGAFEILTRKPIKCWINCAQFRASYGLGLYLLLVNSSLEQCALISWAYRLWRVWVLTPWSDLLALCMNFWVILGFFKVAAGIFILTIFWHCPILLDDLRKSV